MIPDLASVDAAPTPRLSKSKFLAGLQCHKRVYLEVHHPNLASTPDASTRAMLDMGSEIGERARDRFPGGVLIGEGHRHREAALIKTASLIGDGAVPAIFEGAFQYGGVLVRVDVLERVVDEATQQSIGWRLIEVKSSSKVKEIHLRDVAIQRYVLEGAGVNVVASCIMHINTQYHYPGGDIDLGALFVVEDISAGVAELVPQVPAQLARLQGVVMQQRPPSIEPDRHCHTPYECPFWAHCTEEKPARWIYHLPGPKQAIGQLMQQGVLTIDQIPAHTELSIVQRRVRDNLEWISDELGAALESVRFPVHHLDFETMMLAIPRFSWTRPYQAIPVQWSNYIELASGALDHQEFLHRGANDPRTILAEALITSLGREGSVCVYSSYEKAILEQLSESLPELRDDLKQIIGRIWDLYEVIKRHYYHPAFSGSYSIKAVLPAIVPS
ncbi:MAG TPA: DUF2779 domain-containing protein, partial [Nitrospiraceae bacterium]